MSGVVKSVGKVFKKIAKSPIGQLALGAAVSYFTMGLGTSLMGSAFGTTFAKSVLGQVLTGALSGAATGAITAGISGGDPLKGALFGGIGGAVMGGAKSFLGDAPLGGSAGDFDGISGTDLVGASDAGNLTSSASLTAGTDSAVNYDAFGDPIPANYVGQPQTVAPSSPVLDAAGINYGEIDYDNELTETVTAPKTGSRGLLDRLLPSSDEVKGRVIGGAAEAGLKGLLSGDDSEALLQANREKIEAQNARQTQILDARAASHGGTRGLLPGGTGQPAAPPGAVSPAQRFGAGNLGQYVYDPQKGRIVFQQQPAAA